MDLIVLEDIIDISQLKTLHLTKSESSCMGASLRQAHYELGTMLAEHIKKSNPPIHDSSSYAVVILMRAGLNIGLGIADTLEGPDANVSVYFADKNGLSQEDLSFLQGKKVIIADAVINTGKSIFKILDQLEQNQAKNTIICTIVMPIEAAQTLSKSLNIVTARVSNNQYRGAKVKTVSEGLGPDTGDRLFGTI